MTGLALTFLGCVASPVGVRGAGETNQTAVVPPAYEHQEAGGGSSVLSSNIRLQEIYDASSLPGGPIRITEIRFRPSANYGAAFSSTISNIQIRLSSTPVSPAALSPTFALNVGANDTVVFDGALSLGSSFTGPPGGPKAFDIVVPLTPAFTYDPATGNLLVDFRNFSGSTATHVDAGAAFDHKANRAFALGAESTSATTVDFGAEVLQLIYEAVPAAPVILSQPTHRSVVLGGTTVFTVTASSASPLSYQWRFNGDIIEAATGASLVVSNAQFAQAGDYSVVVSNPFDAVTSSNATLTVTNPPPPIIVEQPASQTVIPGGVAAFGVTVASLFPPTYQWSHAGAELSGATNSLLVLSNVQPAQAGAYSVAVTTPYGSATSSVAILTVTNAATLIVHPMYAQQDAGAGSSVLFNAIHLQEVYAAPLFPPGQILLTELRFRPSATSGRAFSTTISNIQINLSTTTRQPGQLSTTFNENVGADSTVVFQGALVMASAFAGPSGGPKDFDMVVPLTTPFLFDASQGNLLVDIRNFSGSTASLVDAGGPADHRVSRVFALGGHAATATSSDYGADVLQISCSSGIVAPYLIAQPQSQFVTEGGTATLSVTARGAAPLSYQWFFNGNPIADANGSSLVVSNAQAAHSGAYFVTVSNGLGATNSEAATLTVDPARTLSLLAPTARQEGSIISVVLALESRGDVGGMTFGLRYDTNYLKDAQMVWSPALEGIFNTVSYAPTGEIRATFVLGGTPLPEGTQLVATVEFLLRSVPNDLDTDLLLQIFDVSDPIGDPIPRGNLVRNASVHITRRLFTGDNNANQRLDVGDATVILRHLATLEQTRLWDMTGNDLNSNGSLDSGDAIKILRVATGIDPQPGGGGAGGFAAASAPPAPNLPPMETMSLSPATLRGTTGSAVTFQILLRNTRTTISGAAFTLDYPTNALRLLDAQAYRTGSLVPGGALTIWNVAPSQNDFTAQNGRLSAAISSATPWAASDGVLAEVTFQVQAGATNRYAWPLALRSCEITPNGYANRFVLPSGAILIGRDVAPGYVIGPARGASGLFQFTVQGDAEAKYVIEASSDLEHWTTVTNFVNKAGTYFYEDPASGNLPYRFYRARPGSN